MQEIPKGRSSTGDSGARDGSGADVASLDEYRRQKASRTRSSRAMHLAMKPLREEDPHFPLGAVVSNRYIILDRVGSGGMGQVYRAWDRILRRSVALKLHQSTIERSNSAEDRFIREAQSLARFTHPNVVTIYECGFHQDSPWISMEFVKGQTLRAWARAQPREWREVLNVMIEVARGIAAIHDEGVIHRDLKPDNVMISDGDRVRIVDFGLALGLRPTVFDGPDSIASEGVYPGNLDAHAEPRLTQAGENPGTPGYMAPEQAGGGEAKFASDQFAWSIMTYELLCGRRPDAYTGPNAVERGSTSSGKRRTGWSAPRWVRRVVERGLNEDPEQRWSNMHVLLAELESGRRRALLRQVLVLVAVLASILVGAELIARRVEAARVSATRAKIEADCRSGSEKIGDVWNADRRRHVRETLETSGANHLHATAERVLRRIDDQAEEWRGTSAEICLALNDEGRLDSHEHRRSAWCLEERRLELDALVEQLGQADAAIADLAVDAASGLSPVALCKNQKFLAHMPPLPSGVSEKGLAETRTGFWRVNALERTGQYDAGLSLAMINAREAESVGWGPLLAGARAQLGGLLAHAGKFQDAESVLRAAYYLALGEAHAVAGGAGMRLSRVIERDPSRRVEASDWWQHGEASISKLGITPGILELEERLERARTLASRGEFQAAEALLEGVLSAQKNLLGEDHPLIAVILVHLAELNAQAGRLAKAREQYEEALPAMETAFGAAHPRLARVLRGFVRTEVELGRTDSAMLLYQRELEILDGPAGSGP